MMKKGKKFHGKLNLIKKESPMIIMGGAKAIVKPKRIILARWRACVLAARYKESRIKVMIPERLKAIKALTMDPSSV